MPRRLFTPFDYGLLALMVLVRIALFVHVHDDPQRFMNEDSRHYEGLALSLLETGTYRYAPYEPYSDLIRPPGYPALIAVTYALFGSRNYAALFFWNLLGLLLTYAGIRLLLHRLSLPGYRLTMLFFALDLAWLLYSIEVVTEPVFTPLLLGALLLLLAGLHAPARATFAGSGLLLGLATLIKPITLYLPLILSPVLGFLTRRWRPAIVFLLAAMSLPTGWMLRNYLTHGTWTYTSIQNRNLLTAHAAFVYADVYDLTHREAQERVIAEVRKVAPAYPNLPFHERSTLEGRVALRILREHPLAYARAILRGMAITLFDPGRRVLNRTFPAEDPEAIGLTNIVGREGLSGALRHLLERPPRQTIPLLTYLGLLLVLNLLALVGFLALLRRPTPAFWLLTVTFLYLWVLGGPNGNARFRMYLLPFLLIYADAGLQVVTVLYRRWRRRTPA